MFSRIAALAIVASLVVVHGQPFPDTPDGEPKAGGDCIISWTPDKTGAWKTAYIELMAGDNFQMEHITTLATVDATDPTNHSLTIPCPAVTPNAPIYFYQFTSPAALASQATWSTRFAIADASGNVVPAANAKQPNGQEIAWGTGALVDPSLAKAAPTDVGSQVTGASGTGAGSGNASASGSVGTNGTAAATPSGSVTAGTQGTAVGTSPSAGASQPANSNSAKASPSAGGSSNSAGSNAKASNTSSAAPANNSNAASTISHAPLYALGAVAAMAAIAL